MQLSYTYIGMGTLHICAQSRRYITGTLNKGQPLNRGKGRNMGMI